MDAPEDCGSGTESGIWNAQWRDAFEAVSHPQIDQVRHGARGPVPNPGQCAHTACCSFRVAFSKAPVGEAATFGRDPPPPVTWISG